MKKQNEYAAMGKVLWDAMNDNERTGVRFGMFPAPKMREAEQWGFTDGRLLALALMDQAKQNGGMRA